MVTGLDCYKFYGDPHTLWDEGIYMTVWDVPQYITDNIPALPRRIYCNKEMIVPMEVAFLALINNGHAAEVKTWDGCFLVRPIRGYEQRVKELLAKGELEKAMIYMSIHSWGVAVDLNAAWNGLGKVPQLSHGFVKCWKDAGFDWGGDWKRLDGMHFQLSYLREESRLNKVN